MVRLWRWWFVWWHSLWRMLRHGFWARKQHSFHWGRSTPSPRVGFRAHPKPAWVKQEVIRLKALMPQAGCRMIAHCFNRRFAVHRQMTVGKTYVADTVRRYQYTIACVRKQIKHRRPRRVPPNLTWGLDLTGKQDAHGRRHTVLGIVEHASRACLTLQALTDKSAGTVLHHVRRTVKRFGPPASLRTDNEALFTSPLFRLGLWVLGIRHQRTNLHCPWQNGRVERFFGTLKQTLDQWQVDNGQQLDHALREFRLFYNHVRPHQHLEGRTPAEAWAGVDVFRRTPSTTAWVEGWNGLVQGYELRL